MITWQNYQASILPNSAVFCRILPNTAGFFVVYKQLHNFETRVLSSFGLKFGQGRNRSNIAPCIFRRTQQVKITEISGIVL